MLLLGDRLAGCTTSRQEYKGKGSSVGAEEGSGCTRTEKQGRVMSRLEAFFHRVLKCDERNVTPKLTVAVWLTRC